MTWRGTAIRLIIIIAAALVAQAWCLGNPWYMDDQLHLFKNERILNDQWQFEKSKWRMWTYIVWILLKNSMDAPMVDLQVPFHALNLVMHVLISVTAFFLMRKLWTFRPEATDKGANNFGMWAALMFAVHPLVSEVVNYAAQTSIQWVTLFSLLAGLCTLFFLRRPHVVSGGLVVVCIAFAAMSKEVGFLFAAMVVFMLFVLLSPWATVIDFTKRNRGVAIGIAVALVAVLTVFYYTSYWHLWLERSLENTRFNSAMLTQARVFWGYASRIVIPVGLCSDHLVAASVDGNDRMAALALFGVLLVVALTVICLFTKRKFGALLLLLGLLPILARFVYPSAEYMVEYRLYPAMPWIGAFIALLLLNAGEKWDKLVFLRFLPHAVALVFIGLSIDRAQDWKTPFAISENILKQYPLHIRVQSYLQWHELDAKKPEAAIERQSQIEDSLNKIMLFNRNSRFNNHRKYNLGKAFGAYMASEQLCANAMTSQGRPQDAIKRLNRVIAKFKKMRNGDDNSRGFGVIYRARGLAHLTMRQFDKARADFNRSLERHPRDVTTKNLINRLNKMEANYRAKQEAARQQRREQRRQQQQQGGAPVPEGGAGQ